MALALDLSGRVVLVTGGTRGIGLGISEAFRAAGARVLTCSRSEVDAPDHYVCDVRDPDAVQALVARWSPTPGGSTCWSTTRAGRRAPTRRPRHPASTTRSSASTCWRRCSCAQAANAVMQQQEGGGVIVNISSVSATRPSPGTAAYGAAKAGLDSLTVVAGGRVGPEGPGQLDRRRTLPDRRHRDHYGGDAQVAAIERTIPLGRMARPEEVGHVAVFLASDLASYVSGARVECHGGGEPPVFLAALEGQS